ncbi:MAG: ATP-binding protein [Bacillota bacterium]
MLIRKINRQLKNWKQSPRRKPLILQGIRQVGKTYSLKEFGESEYADCAYFNFDENKSLQALFARDKNPERLLHALSVLHGKKIVPENTLVIFDEIQECNDALNSLKYFCEKAPEYHIVCAGSLLGVTLSQPGSFPVGKVDFLTMHPLSFREYIESAGESMLGEYLDQIIAAEEIPLAIFEKITDLRQNYLLCGGMPEAVGCWLVSKDVEETEKVLAAILLAYERDFSKHAPAEIVPRIQRVWNSIPEQLAKENGKFVFGMVKEGARAREYETALEWIVSAGLAHKVERIDLPQFPLNAYANSRFFKLHLPDVGLLRRKTGVTARMLLEGSPMFSLFTGPLTENFVLQQLIAQDIVPYYWTSGNTAEVDFIFQYQELILPLEVKAAENVRSKSLQVYRDKYSPIVALRTSQRNLVLNGGVLNIPLGLIGCLPNLLKKYLN